ncbi:hypothetical protein [Acetanaerobacterium elongatum]|uniref:Mannosyl-glycoprotein endo-beta-N-acetylglucosaminidase n=1 Tax=Acetanaerobacterium elongatum TaxID=258515 RepID=A0A1G9Z0B7_9FIRM|nr:hypothetical protein [Acetanaerobacterium elongatum]SDN14637.1 hypothetical protein SAMN05192585_11242 [Acetanaerobacterium elongatum]
MRKLRVIISLAAALAALTISVQAYDLRKVSDITPEQLEPYMHPDTRHLAVDIIRICAQEGVSAEFIATVVRWERIPELHNWFGWKTDDGQYKAFATDTEGLEYCIHNIKTMYLTDTGEYYSGGYDVAAVSKLYNNTDFWREEIESGIMNIVERSGQP